MTTIKLYANNEVLDAIETPIVSSGDVNCVELLMSFSEEWKDLVKTAVFFNDFNDKKIYENLLVNGKCVVPSEVLQGFNSLYIGVRGVNSDGNIIKTTTVIKYKIEKGAPSGRAEPTPGQYEQILTAYGKLEKGLETERTERKAEVDVERQRINNLAKLQEGSTTGDAELADIRVGADGKNYENAGDAVRGQVTALKEDFAAFKNGTDLTFLHANIKYGIRLSQNNGSSFSEAKNPKFACIQFLEVDVNRPIKISVENGFKIYLWCTDVNELNNENGNYRIMSNWATGTNEIECPYKYLMASITSVNDIDIPIGNLVDVFYEDKPKYTTQKDNAEILGNVLNVKWKDGEFVDISRNGIFKTSPNWKRTEPIKVYEKTLIKFRAYFGGSAGAAFYDKNGNCIKTIDNTKENHTCIEFTEIVPENANTFIYSHEKKVQNELQTITFINIIPAIYEKMEKTNSYNTAKNMIESGAKGECRVGGYLFRNNVPNPRILTHKQEAQPKDYFDVNSSIKQYEVMNKDYPHIEKFAFNDLPCEEIDFSPSDKGFIRIIVGKSSDDTFFVSHEASNYNNTFGNPDYDRLEITKDFKTFKTIWKSCNLSTISDGAIHLDGITNIKVKSVKEFSNGNFLVGASCKYPHNSSVTSYFILSPDMKTLTECNCTDQNGIVGFMRDENGGNIYDWHLDVKGKKAICTTYGNRKPETCLGVVWYTEDCGKNWQEVFRMVNHYQDGVAQTDAPVTETHIHGVMLDPFSDRMFVIAGENNQNIFWNNKGKYARDINWNVIPIRRQLMFDFTPYTQVVNGYAFKDSLIFGSDQFGIGGIFRLNKLDSGEYSDIEIAHEFLPNIDLNITSYCTAEMFRRDSNTPLLMCQTREMNGRTETENEKLNKEHFGRVVATYDGMNFVEVWKDTTYGNHDVNIDATLTKRNFSYCTRGMNCYLLQNGDAVIKYSGRDVYYFGGEPASSVYGNANGTSKVLVIKNAIKVLM